jgi:purine-binding chemotaxis protein CheW
VTPPKQLCTFTLGDLYLGIGVERVQEVIRTQPMTRIPLAAAAVTGLINLRGQIVTAIDLRRRLDLADRPADACPVNLVIRTDDGPMSLLVDEIDDVTEVTDDAFESLPDTVHGAIRDNVLGVHKLANRLLLTLDTEKLVRVT